MGRFRNHIFQVAKGFQEVDDQGRTIRLTLSFDFAEVPAAEHSAGNAYRCMPQSIENCPDARRAYDRPDSLAFH